MFKKLKQKKYQKAMHLALSNRDYSQINCGIETVAILYDGTIFIDQNKVLEVVKKLHIATSKIQMFSFVTYQKNKTSLVQNQFCEKDISFYGSIKNKALSSFVETPFDLLLYYNDVPHLQLDLIAGCSKAKFKVGIEGLDARIFDLILAIDISNIDLAAVELEKYCRILRKI